MRYESQAEHRPEVRGRPVWVVTVEKEERGRCRSLDTNVRSILQENTEVGCSRKANKNVGIWTEVDLIRE